MSWASSLTDVSKRGGDREKKKREGFTLGLPLGHFAGLDVMEGRVSPDSQVVLEPGIAVVIHPCVMNAQEIRFLWGQTYFITNEGPVRLNQADDALLIV